MKFHPSYPFIFGVFSPFITGSGAHLVTLTVVLDFPALALGLTSRRPGRFVRFWHGEGVPHLSSWTWAHVASALMYDWRGFGRWKLTINMNIHSKKKQTWNSFWDYVYRNIEIHINMGRTAVGKEKQKQRLQITGCFFQTSKHPIPTSKRCQNGYLFPTVSQRSRRGWSFQMWRWNRSCRSGGIGRWF